jgi:AAA family ATP:ADP antiporter
LILSTPNGAQWKSYGAALQALVLMGYIPLYSWFTSRVDRMKLILGVNLFFLACIEIFSVAITANVPYVGLAFFVWVGIFSLSMIAQFWSWANDIYSEETGKRLFPVIAIGATLGSPFGSKIASILFDTGMKAQVIMQISAGLLILSALLYWYLNSKSPQIKHGAKAEAPLGKQNGFSLVLKSRYLLLIAALLLVLNLVNTTGEFILSSKVVEAAEKAISSNPGVDKKAFIGSFYGNFFFIVNITAFLVQTFLVSRIVKYFGMAGVVLLLPFIALGAYGLIAAGVGLALIRVAKIAENSTDYSVMNTARAMLWLPTSREEKYKAKQTVDTFIVRVGDMLSAGVVFVGLTFLQLSTRGFAIANIIFCGIWLTIAFALLRHYHKISKTEPAREPELVKA